jgi:hypothetical protein
MCDFSLQAVKSRSAKVGDKLITKNFGRGTTGFADVSDADTAVCIFPGTEIAFEDGAPKPSLWDRIFGRKPLGTVAIFRQINKDQVMTHHDALEYPGGEIQLLTAHAEGRRAVVLQLPAAPKTKGEAEEQKRVPIAA